MEAQNDLTTGAKPPKKVRVTRARLLQRSRPQPGESRHVVSIEYRNFFFYDVFGHAHEDPFPSNGAVPITQMQFIERNASELRQSVITFFNRLGFEVVSQDKLTVEC